MTPEELMQKGALLLKSKGDDYTENRLKNRYQNFERQAVLTSWFNFEEDKAFVSLIAVKLARLSALLNNNKTPNNESIEDTFIDLINYCSLWGGSRTTNK